MRRVSMTGKSRVVREATGFKTFLMISGVLLVGGVYALLGSTAIHAQSDSRVDSTVRHQFRPKPPVPRLDASGDFIGKAVENYAGERLGRVVDAVTVVDSENGGRASFALLSLSEVIAQDNKLYPVPARALTAAHDSQNLLLDLTGRELRRTGGFSRNKWPAMTDRVWTAKLYRQFGLSPN